MFEKKKSAEFTQAFGEMKGGGGGGENHSLKCKWLVAISGLQILPSAGWGGCIKKKSVEELPNIIIIIISGSQWDFHMFNLPEK